MEGGVVLSFEYKEYKHHVGLQNLAPTHLTKWFPQRISSAAMFQRDLT